MQAPTSTHAWKFFRAGGFDQVRLDSGADLMALDELDQKLWVALACPTRGLEFDAKTLDLIDTDKDGRVRALELIAGVKWAGVLLKNPEDLLKESSSLPLAAINDSTPEGKTILSSARQILIHLGKKDATAISLEDTTDTVKILAQTAFNGDGVILPESAADDDTKAVINDIIATQGTVPDRSGRPGIDQAKVDAFFADATAFSEWVRKSESDAPNILPLGADTAAASVALKAVKAKIDDYFGRCRLAAFDPRALAALNREEKEYLALVARDLTITAAEVAGFPLAMIAPGKPLPLRSGVNPAWMEPIAAFQAGVVKPLMGDKTELTEGEWKAVCAKFGAYECWIAGQAGASVEKLGIQRVREILGSRAKETLATLVVQDKAEESNVSAITTVDKLVRFHRDLYRLCINFVNFKDFYDRGDPAIFQAGTLYLDQRSCDLCLTVEDPGKHAIMAGLSGTYLAYCDCVRKGTGEKLQIVAAFTGGDSDNLMVGRNGLFYDRKGRDWDATITKLVDNPISVRQAFWSPYKKLARFIQEQIAKRAATADSAAVQKLTQAAVKAEEAALSGKVPEPPPKPKLDTGLIAALSVGAAGVGGMIGGIVSSFLGLKAWMPIGVLGILLLISGPSMIMAYLKLRKRNLGPILDANGWAVNAKARINVPFGGALTQVAALPPGSQRDLTDPFAEDHRRRNFWTVVALIVALLAGLWFFGALDRLLPDAVKRTSVLPGRSTTTNAPAGEPAK